MKKGKIIIVSAPSGSGKSTILSYILSRPELNPYFSISATSRAPRGAEKHGCEYHFLTKEDFEQKISEGAFIEYEEVYSGTYYGTLRSEVDTPRAEGKNVFLDIDVKGALRLKKEFGNDALFIFIQPPSLEVLRERLIRRGTETAEKIDLRLARAEEELSYARYADQVIVNDNLDEAKKLCYTVIKAYLELD
ncbi:MAG: guanylate kinase [Porphyromonas sp.]|nr:guanylate kinase [Bacteroidales bacterium]MDD7559105.1 guanylate kinase [Bacteroidales bacterium]MDY3100496.1 guanylate kinase [Porphyromonas sp.]